MAKPFDKFTCIDRTVEMMAYFLQRPRSALTTEDDLREQWGMSEDDFEILEAYIERPITTVKDGFFQDVGCDVKVKALKKAQTIGDLADVIWKVL